MSFKSKLDVNGPEKLYNDDFKPQYLVVTLLDVLPFFVFCQQYHHDKASVLNNQDV